MRRANSPRERTVVEACKRELKAWRAYFFKAQGGGYGGVAGQPDLNAVVPKLGGRFVGVECKRPGGSHPVTEAQRAQLRSIVAAGGLACVVDSQLQLRTFLETAAEEGASFQPGAVDLREGGRPA